MKKYYAWSMYIAGGLAVALMGCAGRPRGDAPTQVATQTGSSGLSAAQTVGERGPHYRKIAHVRQIISPDGQTISKTNRYTELATGICYQNENGEWIDSKEVIEIVPGGALASQGAHRVGFAANINTAGAINILTSDAKRIRSHVIGLAYTDAQTGQSVLIAQIKDSIGVLIGENQIVYADAFTDLQADVRYTYTRAGLEQDIILRQEPPAPAAFGLNPVTTRLEVFTEFVEAPVPEIGHSILSATADPVQRAAMTMPDFVDETLNFGAMQMGSGQAFPLFAQTENVPTGKTWELRDGRRFLIEAVQYPAIKRELDALAANPGGGQQAKVNRMPGAGRSFPAAPKQANATKGQIKTAFLDDKRAGYVIDWSLMASDTNFTFRGDNTYHVTALVNLSGTTVFEGGAVIKYTNNVASPRLVLKGPVDFRTQPYLPVMMTATDDDTVGEIISGSTGTPTNHYAVYALAPNSTTNFFSISNVVIRYARTGIQGLTGAEFEVLNAQFYRCLNGIGSQKSTAVRNCLFSLSSTVFVLGAVTNRGEHLTFARCDRINPSPIGYLYLTNCLIVAATNFGIAGGVGNYSNSVFGNVFQTVGAGDHYLKDSTYRDLGTTNINPALLASLRNKTTYPPLWLSNSVTTNLVLAPAILRDTNTPDIGYHYEPLDYLVSGLIVTNATLVFTNGVALGVDYSVSEWGFILKDGKLVSEGSALAFNRIVRAHMVQERSSGNPPSRAVFYDDDSLNASNEMRMRFTFFSQLADDGYMLYTGQKFRALEWTHSTIYNPSVVINTAGDYPLTCGLTNSLWERGGGQFDNSSLSSNSVVYLRNNLFKNFALHFFDAHPTWRVNDNLVDGAELSGFYDHGVQVTNANNAYSQAVTNILSGGTSNLTVTNLSYVVGPLGNYYHVTNSVLINRGSVTADQVGLYHFTTTVDQTREANSIVNIGPHWVSLDVNGSPHDFDVDGIADFLDLDADADGILDSIELLFGLNPLSTDAPFTISITQPAPDLFLP